MAQPKLMTIERPAPQEFVETPSALEMLSILQTCLDGGRMAAIIGQAGLGKTTTFRQFKHQTRGAAVWIATLSRVSRSLTSGLDVVIKAIEGWSHERGPMKKRLALVDRIGREIELHGRALLIIDEGQHADDDLLEELRSIHDQFGADYQGRFGLVFSGNPTVLSRWYRDTGSRLPRPKFASFTGRLFVAPELAPTQPEDTSAIAASFGIEDVPAVAFLHGEARTGEGLRRAVKIIHGAAALKIGGGTITLADLEEAKAAMFLRSGPLDPGSVGDIGAAPDGDLTLELGERTELAEAGVLRTVVELQICRQAPGARHAGKARHDMLLADAFAFGKQHRVEPEPVGGCVEPADQLRRRVAPVVAHNIGVGRVDVAQHPLHRLRVGSVASDARGELGGCPRSVLSVDSHRPILAFCADHRPAAPRKAPRRSSPNTGPAAPPAGCQAAPHTEAPPCPRGRERVGQ